MGVFLQPLHRSELGYVLALALLFSVPLWSQDTSVTLSGTITVPSGAIVPHATVSLGTLATGHVVTTGTDSAGRYSVPDLLPGAYQVSVSAAGFGTADTTVTITAAATQTLNVTLRNGLSLEDLGFSTAQTHGS